MLISRTGNVAPASSQYSPQPIAVLSVARHYQSTELRQITLIPSLSRSVFRSHAEEHIRNLTREIESFKKSQASDPINANSDPINSFADPITEQLYQAIMNDGTLSYAAYGELIGVSEATIKRRLGELKKSGLIVRVGANKNGHWEVL